MEMSDLVRELLQKRDITDIDSFLNPSYEAHLHDPFLLSDMAKAQDRFFLALMRGERIAIYADFDCDGLGGASVFHDFFKRIGYDNFEIYQPHRDEEGYGFHAPAVRKLAERGAGLIITVDVGISGHEGVKTAKSAGVDVIITDHHEVMAGVPEALAVVNPKLPSTGRGQAGGYPFAHLCGAAVAFKFVQAALSEGRKRGLPEFLRIPEGWEKWLLDVVAIATISDMVPLTGENRVLVHYGLRVLRQSRRPGLRALAEVSSVRLSAANEDDLGYSLAPRLNAASRMDHPELALRLLTTEDRLEADRLARTLEDLNAKRRGLVAAIVKEAKKRARERYPDEALVVLGDTTWKPALLGLAANSLLTDKSLHADRQVVCLWGRDAAGNLKGSCRSDGVVSLADLFSSASDAFLEFGGHARAGGFSVSSHAVHTLHERLSEAMRNIGAGAGRAEPAGHDATLPLSALSAATLREVSLLSPFGIGNPKPIFHIPETRVIDVRRFGKEKRHVEVTLECPASGRRLRSFDFYKEPAAFSLAPSVGIEARVLGTLERDSFRGADALALRIVDILPLC